MKRMLTPIKNYSELEELMKSAGAWFIGSFMLEFVDSYEVFQNRERKTRFIEYFWENYLMEYLMKDMNQLRNRINIAVRIIESDMVKDAMEYVLRTNDEKIGCDESKTNAQFLLDRLASGESKLPVFE